VTQRQDAVQALQARISYVFHNPQLLEEALTHRSVGQGARKVADYERLEFLGDRVLGLITAQTWMAQDPAADVGTLSKRLSALVSGPACAAVARSIDLGPALRLPGGEARRGARDQDTFLADACEALIAAVYLDGGLAEAERLVTSLWAGQLATPLNEREVNPKSELQEWAAALGRSAPVYSVVKRTGPDHEPEFTVSVQVSGLAEAVATGGSRQSAEKAAARLLLERERTR